MKKLLFLSLIFFPISSFAAFSGTTPASPVNTDASGVDVCYPYVYAYNGAEGRTYIASTEPVDFTGSGAYQPIITNDGTGRFLKDSDHTSANPPSQTDWDDYSTDYNTSDAYIFASWWTDNGVSNIGTCMEPMPPLDDSFSSSVYLVVNDYALKLLFNNFMVFMLLGIAFYQLKKSTE